ncbi:hypothetical protein HY641_03075 [Candidatus Woesearchaeota archaeon]|nr:hypothetical protein [Candidatus Woesearchaeota archaeon]
MSLVSVLGKTKLAEGIHYLLLKTPEMSKKTRPGQYILIKKTENSQTIPAFVAEKDKKGIGVIIDAATAEGKQLADLKKGSELYTVTGPLGKPVRVGDFGNVCIITEARGVGAAMLISQSLRNFENKVYFIASFANKKQRFWEPRVKKAADKFLIVTQKQDAIIDEPISELSALLRRKHMTLVIALCSPQMLRKVAKATELRSRTLTLLLPPIGDDGIGLSSSCRFTYDNESRLACVEGPAIDAHKTDWDSVCARWT